MSPSWRAAGVESQLVNSNKRAPRSLPTSGTIRDAQGLRPLQSVNKMRTRYKILLIVLSVFLVWAFFFWGLTQSGK
jgi:ABC-type uncharacterized transport system permease subunit